jgi:predicted transcriptional regulator
MKESKRRPGRPRGGGRRIQDYIDALKKSGGFVSGAADLLGVSTSTVSKMIKKHKRLQEVMEEVNTRLGDIAEAAWIKELRRISRKSQEQPLSAVEFRIVKDYLMLKHKDRGYVERTEHHISGQAGVMVVPGVMEDTEEWSRMAQEWLSRSRENGLDGKQDSIR